MSGWTVEAARDGAAEIGALLGRSFCDNPGMVAALGEPRSRRALRASRLMQGLARVALRCGRVEVVRAAGRVVGVSMAYAPGQMPRGLAQVPAILGALSTGPACVLRLKRLDDFLHHNHLRTPHMFLAILGVEPELQGRKIGSALLRSLSARADVAGLPCYLETDRERNVRIYEQHGYAVMSEHVLPQLSGVRFWLMQRAIRR